MTNFFNKMNARQILQLAAAYDKSEIELNHEQVSELLTAMHVLANVRLIDGSQLVYRSVSVRRDVLITSICLGHKGVTHKQVLAGNAPTSRSA